MNTVESPILSHPFGVMMPQSFLNILSEGATEMNLQTGQVLLREGESADHFYLIQSGAVAVESRNALGRYTRMMTLRDGDVLGWSWLFPPFTWHFRARTIEPTHAIVLKAGPILVACEENPAFGYELMKRMTQVLIQRLEARGRI